MRPIQICNVADKVVNTSHSNDMFTIKRMVTLIVLFSRNTTLQTHWQTAAYFGTLREPNDAMAKMLFICFSFYQRCVTRRLFKSFWHLGSYKTGLGGREVARSDVVSILGSRLWQVSLANVRPKFSLFIDLISLVKKVIVLRLSDKSVVVFGSLNKGVSQPTRLRRIIIRLYLGSSRHEMSRHTFRGHGLPMFVLPLDQEYSYFAARRCFLQFLDQHLVRKAFGYVQVRIGNII